MPKHITYVLTDVLNSSKLIFVLPYMTYNERGIVMERSIEEEVKGKYGVVATSGLSSRQAGIKAIAEAFGYSESELVSIPAEANMGLSCGNPTAFASLREGEVVVDLGCGGGLDVFLASQKVGVTGRAIGIDMTPEMLALAKRNAERGGYTNVEFYQATIDRLPLEDSSVDCVISNCVINLAPDKQAVFREIARVLKPGGRLAVTDIALKRPLPAEIGQNILAYVGCVAGAILVEDYRKGLLEAGFEHVEIVNSGSDLNAYAQAGAGCCAPSPTQSTGCCVPTQSSSCCQPAKTEEVALHESLIELLKRYNVNDYAASVRVYAVKP